MKLYVAPGTIAVACAIALEEAGVDHELSFVDVRAGVQNSAGYLAMNPKGRVPTLELDNGTILTETGAILEFVAAHLVGMVHVHG